LAVDSFQKNWDKLYSEKRTSGSETEGQKYNAGCISAEKISAQWCKQFTVPLKITLHLVMLGIKA
jgi:hypothetical protein